MSLIIFDISNVSVLDTNYRSLSVSCIDTIENCEIYKTYMRFGRISDNGNIVQVFGGVVFCRLFQYIATVETPEIANPWDYLPSLRV